MTNHRAQLQNFSDRRNSNSMNKIATAFERKQISSNYYSNAYPSFLRSSGPYLVYDHAVAKGDKTTKDKLNITMQAESRFKDELYNIA